MFGQVGSWTVTRVVRFNMSAVKRDFLFLRTSHPSTAVAHLFSGFTISPVFLSPGKQPLAPAVTTKTGLAVLAFFIGGSMVQLNLRV